MTVQVILTLKKSPRVPVEAEVLIPENVTGKNEDEIGRLKLLVGKKWEAVADWFHVNIDRVPELGDNEQSDPSALLLKGDLRRFKRLGQGMSNGVMEVDGSTGFHAGAGMSGGTLIIRGDAADFLGAHMKAGLIVVQGNAGHYAAAAYRGYTRGMMGGVIIITGNAGQMLGARMRRGLICLLGDCGDVAGYNMKAGTIIVAGKPGARVGARMVRGTIVLLDHDTDMTAMPPTFSYNCTYHPPFWRIIHGYLANNGFVPEASPHAVFSRYNGDTNEGGKGEVWILVPGTGRITR
jgi:formylmethanofuran dehydrogenase subunit C